jgi:DHA1 family inner membrane transport protein
VAFYFTVHSTVPALVTLVFIGALGALVTTPVQMLLMAKAKNAPTMAAASNHSAFNLANAGGAWLGGLAISAGWGWTSPALVGAVMAAAGLALAVTGGLMDRGTPSDVVASAGAGQGTVPNTPATETAAAPVPTAAPAPAPASASASEGAPRRG